MNDAFLKTFEESYLRELRKSDLEIISNMLVRNIKVACVLPRDQRIAVANLIRDKADLLESWDG
jgi:hypothetical protein